MANSFGKLTLRHPTLTVANNPAIDRPVLWYKLEQYDCGSGIIQSNPGYMKGDDLNDGTLAVSDIEEEQLSVSPNPFVKDLEITIDSQAQITVYNSGNELVYSGSVAPGSNMVNLEKLSKGVYFLKISNRDKIYKIVKI